MDASVPYVDALVWLPEHEVDPALLDRFRVASAFDDDTVVEAFERRDDMVGMPRHAAFLHLRPAEVRWGTAKGRAVVVPGCPQPRSPEQGEFWEAVLNRLKTSTDTVACAATGTGKTVAACYALSQLKRTMLVVVHKGALMQQWRNELMRHCGLTDAEVGQVGDGVCEWDGRKAVVALLQTLRLDNLPEAFWDWFGITVLDEAHTVNAAVSSLVMRRAKSARRLALSATPSRKDGLDAVLAAHFGPVRVTARMEALPMRVNVFCYDNPPPDPRREDGGWPVVYKENEFGKMEEDRMATRALNIKELEADPARFKLSVDLIVRAMALGRRGLVVAESIEYLERLRDAVCHAGVPEDDVGLFTAEATLPTKVWEHEEVEISLRRRLGMSKREKKPLTAVPTHERKRTGRFEVVMRRRKQERADLDAMLPAKRLIFATHLMVKEGVDVPAWDWLHDPIARSEATQLIGRIRRYQEGKKMPLLHTFEDRGCPAMRGNFRSRLNDYRTGGKVSVTFFERHGDKWVQKR